MPKPQTNHGFSQRQYNYIANMLVCLVMVGQFRQQHVLICLTQPLCKMLGYGFSLLFLSQTPLMWEPPALGFAGVMLASVIPLGHVRLYQSRRGFNPLLVKNERGLNPLRSPSGLVEPNKPDLMWKQPTVDLFYCLFEFTCSQKRIICNDYEPSCAITILYLN